MKKILAFTFALFVIHANSQTDITPRVIDALKKGDAAALTSFFMAQVDMTIEGQDGTYEKSQAKDLLGKFFVQHPPKEFAIRHQGTSKLDDQYRIGELVTVKGTYRVTFFMKKSGTEILVRQFKIESPNDDF